MTTNAAAIAVLTTAATPPDVIERVESLLLDFATFYDIEVGEKVVFINSVPNEDVNDIENACYSIGIETLRIYQGAGGYTIELLPL